MASDELTIRWSGGERRFGPGTVRIGRDLDAEVQPANTNVSRRHLEIVHEGGRWVARDLGSAQGTWRDGSQVDEVAVTGSVTLVLGRPGSGETIELSAQPTVATSPPPAATEVVGPGRGAPPPPVEAAGTVIVGGADRPGGRLREEAIAGATVVTGDSIAVECGGRSSTFLPGREVVIGRDAGSDVVSSNPTVSRRHARLVHEHGTWFLEDLDSSSGTFVDGKRIDRLALAGSVAAWLGDEEAGERVVLVAKGTRPPSRNRRSHTGLLVGAVAVVLALVAGGLFFFGGSGPDDDELARGTVRIVADSWVGSGTIVDAERGLILTNAHVAEPSAPGAAVDRVRLADELDDNPGELEIQVATGKDRDAEPRYVGTVAAVDGYLDLAVVKITETIGGRIIEKGDLDDLTQIEIGDSDALETGDEIRVLGYPTASESGAVTLTKGVVSGPVKDERLRSNRAMVNIDAEIRGGNSGGLAVNEDGRIVGIPTIIRGGSVSSMRPVSWAQPLIEAARSGKAYTSPYIRELDDESISNISFVAPGRSDIQLSCTTGSLGSETRAVGIAFDFDGFKPDTHQDVLVKVYVDGEPVGAWAATDDYPFRWPESGCATVTIAIPADSLSETSKISARVGLGPEYTPVR